MATIRSQRAALFAAFATAGINASDDLGRIDPPVIYVFGGGSDMAGIGRGQIQAGFRLVLVGGLEDGPAASAEIDVLAQAALTVLRALSWRIGPLEGDAVRTYAGGSYLTAALTAFALIDV